MDNCLHKLFVFISFLYLNTNYSQKISGTITSQGKPISGVSITVKKDVKILEFTFSDTLGKFKLNKSFKDSIEIHVSRLNYKKQVHTLVPKNDTLIHVELSENEILLNEVVIKRETPIQNKKDTVVYNPKFFKDGSEKVLEDVLKKLPGIAVKNNGKIYFKDKEIQALMLEGDDLFNSQYTIGSKNIDIDLVESIEAIDNFNTNKVLHQITDSENVALNIKLKKDNSDLSLNTTLENDFFSKYNNSLTGIAIASKYKGFATLAFNNIGIVADSNFSFSKNEDASIGKEKNKELLSQGNFPNFLGNTNSMLNKSISNYNVLSKNITKKTKTIFGFGFYDDSISQDFNSKTNYKVEQENFDSYTEEIQDKTSKVFSLNNTTTYFNGKDFQIESKILVENNKGELLNNLDNNNLLQYSNLSSKALFIAGKSEITKKLSTDSAINLNVFYSNNDSKQNLFLEPGLVSLDSSNLQNEQQSNIKTLCLNSNFEFYKNWPAFKWKVSNTTEYQKDHLQTDLFNQNNVANTQFVNNFYFKNFTNQLKIKGSVKHKKNSFGATINFWHNHLGLSENKQSKEDVLFSVYYKYTINKKNHINVVYYDDIKAPTLDNVFEGNIVSSYRTIISNQQNLDYVKNKEVKMSYTLNDLYHTLFFNVGIGYSTFNKDYYYKNQITTDLIVNKTILLDKGNDKTYVDLTFHKLIPFLKTTVKLNSRYSVFSSFNFVNTDELRKIKNTAINFEMLLYTGFKTKLNFQNKINSESNFYKINENANSTLTQFKNEFNVMYQIFQQAFFKAELQTFIPDDTKKHTFNFLNFVINYKYEKHHVDLYLKGQNLLNIKKFEDFSISDFSTSIYSYNLQERYIILGANFKIF